MSGLDFTRQTVFRYKFSPRALSVKKSLAANFSVLTLVWNLYCYFLNDFLETDTIKCSSVAFMVHEPSRLETVARSEIRCSLFLLIPILCTM